MKLKINWDAMGIFTSVACAIHCALLPILLTALPIFGTDILHDPAFEWGMILLAFVIGALTLRHGYRKHHQSFMPILIFSTGFVFLVLKQFFLSVEFWFLAIAFAFIVSAHFFNYRLSNQRKCILDEQEDSIG